MKITIISYFLLFPIILVAQKCDTIEGRLMNCVDKDLLKQGFWYEYHTTKILITDSFRRNPNAIGFHNDEGLVHTPIAEGYYKNNRRIGTWTFYTDFYNNPDAHTKTVLFTDSGFRYEIDSFYHYNFKISDDTSFLAGKLYLKKDTINIICKEKKCQLYNPFEKKKERFKWTDLDAHVRFLNFRSYKVKEKKTGS
jgi:hypothetical protein